MKNLEGKTLFGMTLGKNCFMEKDSWKDYFDIVEDYDETELILKFKQEFSNDFFDEGNEIKYHYYLEVYNGNIYDEAGVWFEIYLIPKIEHVHKNNLEELYEDYDTPPKDEWLELDLLRNTQCPLIINKEIEIDLNEEWYPPKMVDILETMTNIIPFINQMIGFYMDRHINPIGTTNWDCLKSLMDGSDWTHWALDRYREEMKKNVSND